MRQGLVKYNNELAGILTEDDNGEYLFVYDEKYIQKYAHQVITFQMPVSSQPYKLQPFFDQLPFLLSDTKLRKNITQNLVVGHFTRYLTKRIQR